jgi:hypothetical protein
MGLDRFENKLLSSLNLDYITHTLDVEISLQNWIWDNMESVWKYEEGGSPVINIFRKYVDIKPKSK